MEDFAEDLRGFGVNQLLPVQGEEALSGVESEALEYLRQVRNEAAQLPMVVTSEIDARAFDDCRTTSYIKPEEEDAYDEPPYSWMCKVVDDFMLARAEVAEEASVSHTADEFPSVTDWQAWHRLISQEKFQPFSATLGRMDNALAVNCLSHLTNGMQAASRSGNHISSHTGLWMYGLLVRLEKPIHSRLAATLRQLTQLSRKLRPRGFDHAPGSLASTLVPIYDTLLVLAGGYFGQDPALAPLVDEYICLNHTT